MAQVDNGSEVTVNPIPGGGGVLLYPGGQYTRVLPPLLQPGQRLKEATIQLHMPGKHRAHAASSAVAQASRKSRAAKPVRQAAATPAPKPTPKPAAPTPAAKQTPAPAPATQTASNFGGFGNFGAPASLIGPTPPPSKPAAPPRQVAKAEPPPASSRPEPGEAPPPMAGLTKASVILFAPDATDPAKAALGAIKYLAGELNSQMTGPNSRIELMAYAGARGDKGSDARRLSLKRALAIRQVLIDDGVPAERIDLHMQGGADDGGPADRVDVFVKA